MQLTYRLLNDFCNVISFFTKPTIRVQNIASTFLIKMLRLVNTKQKSPRNDTERENQKDCPNLLTPAFCLTHNIFPFSSSHPFLQHSRINLSVIQIYWTTNHLVHLSKCSTGTILKSRKFRIVFVLVFELSCLQCIEESLTGWIDENIKSISEIGGHWILRLS